MIHCLLRLLVFAALYLIGWQFDRRYYVRKIRPTKLHITDLTDGKLITYRWVHTRHYVWAFILLFYISFMTWIACVVGADLLSVDRLQHLRWPLSFSFCTRCWPDSTIKL